jgi:hypothetical protein
MKKCVICKKPVGKWRQKYCSDGCHYKQKRINDNASFRERYYPNKYSEYYQKYYKENPRVYLKVLKTQATRRQKLGLDKLRYDEIREGSERRRMLNKGLPARTWTAEEIEYLEENYLNKLVSEMAKELGRSWTSVSHKLCRLGLIYYNKWNKI